MFLALGFVVGILLIILYRHSKSSKLPPGPWGFPILGHLPLMGGHPAKALFRWKSIYGPIISVRFGSLTTVVFNDFEVVKEAFMNPALQGRKDVSYFREATNQKGIIFGEGPPVYEQRRFIMKAMKDFGIRSGGAALEFTIQTEISELLNLFKLQSGQPMKVHHAFSVSMVNAVWVCLTGKRFEQGDPNLRKLADICSAILGVPTAFEMLGYFIPWLAKLAPNLTGYNKGLTGHQELVKFIQKHIAETEETREKDNPRNLADAYMDKVENTTDEQSSFFALKNMQAFTFSDLFIGGIDTTSTLLEWVLAYLAVHPNVQTKLQKEIFKVTGNTRVPSFADRSSMPYTEAVIYETLRKVPLVTLNLGKQALEDVIFHGYTIPKGTMLYGNFYGILSDPDIWGDPENFRPERFIDEDTGKFKKREELIIFGMGKRACVGESLAKDQSFLYVASLFQKFNVSCVPGKPVNLTGKFGFVVHPHDSNEVILEARD